MPDFSMCNTSCQLSQLCRRHEDSGTKPSEYQRWNHFEYDDGCEYFWRKNKWEQFYY